MYHIVKFFTISNLIVQRTPRSLLGVSFYPVDEEDPQRTCDVVPG